jgi:GUN4-like/Caspase domain
MGNNAAANNWAIVVGVNDYDFLPEAPLRFAVKDALAMKAFLCEEAGFPEKQVLLCGDGSAGTRKATRPILRDILRREIQHAKDADNLWFFFSGHGLGEHLMTIDGNPNDLPDTAISIHFVTERLRACKAKNIVLVLDMCRNEHHDVGQKTAVSVADSLKKLVQDREGQQGIITLFSCRQGEISYEIASLKQGAFTHALLEGLKTQTILKELETYLVQRVPELNSANGKTQKQVPLVIPEPGWKYEQPILSHYAPVGIDYGKLRNLLNAGKWEEADWETYDLMNKVIGTPSIKVKHLKEYPLESIEEIDRIWAEFSSGKFGFKIQAKIWQRCDRDESKFEIQVGWKDEGKNKQKSYKKLIFDPSTAKSGHLPAFFKSWGGGGWSWKAYLLDRVSEGIAPSPVDNVPLESEKGVDYRKLRDLLRDGNWEGADRETLNVVCQATGCKLGSTLSHTALNDLFCKDLRVIDQLWVIASGGRFGFSVQRDVWQKCGGPIRPGPDWEYFCHQVGWAIDGNEVFYASLKKNPDVSPLGELPISLWYGKGGGWVLEGTTLYFRLETCAV